MNIFFPVMEGNIRTGDGALIRCFLQSVPALSDELLSDRCDFIFGLKLPPPAPLLLGNGCERMRKRDQDHRFMLMLWQ